MGKAVQCDRCKAFVCLNELGSGCPFGVAGPRWSSFQTGENWSMERDPKNLCQTCTDDFERFMRGVKLA